jgi:preprotein translocase subunit SecG
MITALTILYVFVCIFLIFVVLLQAGRGGGMGAAFGGSSQTVFGGAGAGNFLTRLTVIMAALFMVLSATLAFLSSSSDKALDRASHAIKMREEARKLSPNDKKTSAAKGAQSSSSSEGAATSPATTSPTGDGTKNEDVDNEAPAPVAPAKTP